MKNKKLNYLTKVSLLGVMGFLLMFLEFPLPFLPPFLKFDFGDLPALLGTFALGPVAGILAELIKNILHGLFGSSSAFVGELANFTFGSLLCIGAGFTYKFKKTKKSAMAGLALGTVLMTISAMLFNYYIFLPLYGIKSMASIIIKGIVPFNIIKGAVISVITLSVYKKVSPVLHKEIERNELESKLS